jgi:hypothetical protein
MNSLFFIKQVSHNHNTSQRDARRECQRQQPIPQSQSQPSHTTAHKPAIDEDETGTTACFLFFGSSYLFASLLHFLSLTTLFISPAISSSSQQKDGGHYFPPKRTESIKKQSQSQHPFTFSHSPFSQSQFPISNRRFWALSLSH